MGLLLFVFVVKFAKRNTQSVEEIELDENDEECEEEGENECEEAGGKKGDKEGKEVGHKEGKEAGEEEGEEQQDNGSDGVEHN